MYDDSSSVGVILLVALVLAGAIVGLIAISNTASISNVARQEAISAALQAGVIAIDMTEQQVLQVWGDPTQLDSTQRKTALGQRDKASDTFTTLFGSGVEQLTKVYNYTTWVYQNPFRTATFDISGHVVKYLSGS